MLGSLAITESGLESSVIFSAFSTRSCFDAEHQRKGTKGQSVNLVIAAPRSSPGKGGYDKFAGASIQPD